MAEAVAAWGTTDTTESTGTRGAIGYARATAVIVHLAVVVVGLELTVGLGVSATLAAAVLLLPLWLPVLADHPAARVILGLAALSVVSGLVLAELSSVDHRISTDGGVREVALLASGITAVCLLLWARSAMPLHRVVALYGAGALAGALIDGRLSWKYDLAVPATLVALGLLERYRSRVLPAAAVVIFGVAGVIDGSRSYFAACLLAAALTIWQLRPSADRKAGSKGSRWFPVALMAAVGAAVYLLLSSLLTRGTFGEELQDRSVAQIEASGSLIAGGRPEWSATRELVALNPRGYGVGVQPNWTDRQAGKTGLASINIDAGGYADHYMFGGQFRLHSVAADLWARYGWAGVALGAAVAVAIVRDLGLGIADRRAQPSVILACVLALWYMAFGPIYSNWLDVCVALGLVLAARPTSSSHDTRSMMATMRSAQASHVSSARAR